MQLEFIPTGEINISTQILMEIKRNQVKIKPLNLPNSNLNKDKNNTKKRKLIISKVSILYSLINEIWIYL